MADLQRKESSPCNKDPSAACARRRQGTLFVLRGFDASWPDLHLLIMSKRPGGDAGAPGSSRAAKIAALGKLKHDKTEGVQTSGM